MSKRGYTGPIIAFNGYYIHYHQKNIGKANKHNIPDIVATFQSHRTNVLRQSKVTYKKLFASNILKSSSKELVEEVFKNEDIFTEINKQMTKQMQELIKTDKLEKLMTIQRETLQGKNKINLSDLISSNSEKQIKEFNNLLERLNECCKLLNGKAGGDLAAILAQSNLTIPKLQEALQNFIENNNGKSINQQRAVAAAQSINALAQGLKMGKTSKKEPLTTDAIKRMIDSIFNTGFGESIASILNKKSDHAIVSSLAQLTGKQTVPGVTISLKKDGKNIVVDSTPRSGKADIKFSNITFEIQQIEGLTSGGKISMTVGLSNKQYRTNHFRNLDRKNSFRSFEYSSGSGGTFKEAIDAIFNSNIYNKYLAYNIMAHRSKRTKEAQALQDLILTRQIVKLFSSRGGQEDFSQWMLVNGEIISIWQIILSTEKFVGLSHSQMTQQSDQVVSLSLPGAKSIEEDLVKIEAKERVPIINKKLNEMTIKAYVHIDKMARALAKST